MLIFKQYDPETRALKYMGRHLISKTGTTIQDCMGIMNGLIGRAADAPLRLKEVRDGDARGGK